MSGARRPIGPTSTVQPAGRADADAPPPRPPHELEPDPDLIHEFEHEAERWIARVAGKGAGGTGAYGLGMIDAIHFHRDTAERRPLFEALLPRGRFRGLHRRELRALLAAARAVPPADAPSNEPNPVAEGSSR